MVRNLGRCGSVIQPEVLLLLSDFFDVLSCIVVILSRSRIQGLGLFAARHLELQTILLYFLN